MQHYSAKAELDLLRLERRTTQRVRKEKEKEVENLLQADNTELLNLTLH